MKEKMLEFILKRLGSRVTDLRAYAHVEDDALSDLIFDDIDAYLSELKSVVADLLV